MLRPRLAAQRTEALHCATYSVQLQTLLKGPDASGVTCVDLREAEEVAAAAIPGFKHFALRQGQAWQHRSAAGAVQGLTLTRPTLHAPVFATRSKAAEWSPSVASTLDARKQTIVRRPA
jgi:rhodanese-related sulfurtransferase